MITILHYNIIIGTFWQGQGPFGGDRDLLASALGVLDGNTVLNGQNIYTQNFNLDPNKCDLVPQL